MPGMPVIIHRDDGHSGRNESTLIRVVESITIEQDQAGQRSRFRRDHRHVRNAVIRSVDQVYFVAVAGDESDGRSSVRSEHEYGRHIELTQCIDDCETAHDVPEPDPTASIRADYDSHF
jgi:hypothetical protein